jgi:Arc/MetJ-type ribon-helix-helix transcriptional regulator
MTNELQTVSVKLPLKDLRRIPTANRSEFIRDAIREKLEKQATEQWKPKTALARKLKVLSDKFQGERLDAEGIARELRDRRGGLG